MDGFGVCSRTGTVVCSREAEGIGMDASEPDVSGAGRVVSGAVGGKVS